MPPGLFTGNFSARALIGGDGFGFKDFPLRLCFDATVPVIGVDRTGTPTGTVADNWDDFVDGIIKMTIASAVGANPTDTFWTGSDNQGEWSQLDCCAWENDQLGLDDGTISNGMNTLDDWIQGSNPGSCDAAHKLLGLAFSMP